MSDDSTSAKFRELWDRRDELPPDAKAQLEAMVERSARMVAELATAMQPIVERYTAAGIEQAERYANEETQ